MKSSTKCFYYQIPMSTNMNSMILKGSVDFMIYGSITIPMDIRVLDTTRSTMRNDEYKKAHGVSYSVCQNKRRNDDRASPSCLYTARAFSCFLFPAICLDIHKSPGFSFGLFEHEFLHRILRVLSFFPGQCPVFIGLCFLWLTWEKRAA